MDFNFGRYLGTVTRSVTVVERDGHPARIVTLARSYETTADDLWDAVTNPERLPLWFLPVSGELKLGGRYQLEGNAGGTITDCIPPGFLAVTWEFGGGMSWVEVRIASEGDVQSRLTLSHICPVDDHWRKYGPGAAGVGWDLGLVGLTLHISRAEAGAFDEAALLASSEGKDFIVGSSEDWRQAAVAAGEDPAWAGTAARLTTAFYTGANPPEE